MSAINTLIPKNNFSGGQISKDVWGKVETSVYGNSLAKMENFLSNPQGSAVYRNGFNFVASVTTDQIRIEEFKFNNQQSYALLIYEGYISFVSYDAGGQFGLVLGEDGEPLKVETNYTWQEVQELKVAQTGDIMFFTHKDNVMHQLIRRGAASFEFLELDTSGLPFGAENGNDDIKIDPSAATGDITLTVTGDDNFFSDDDIGTMMSINLPKEVDGEDIQGYVEITGLVSPTKAAAKVKKDLKNADSTSIWARSAFSKRAGYPAACGLYESRLWFGGTDEEPVGIWGSVQNEFSKFNDGVEADDSVFFRVAEVPERIKWLMGGSSSLMAGTGSGIVTMNGGSSGSAITPTDVMAKLSNGEGSANIVPIRKNSDAFYVDNSQRKIRIFSYNLVYESFTAVDINQLNYDITTGGIKKLCFQQDKFEYIWALKGNGKLVAITFLNEEGLVVNGAFEVSTQGKFKEIGTITREDGSVALIAIVNRGEFGSSIEIMSDYIDFPVEEDFYAGDKVDIEKYKRVLFDTAKKCVHLDRAQTYKDLRTVKISYDGSIVLSSEEDAFDESLVGKEIWFKPEEDGEAVGRFEVVSYVTPKTVEVRKLTEDASETALSWYVAATAVGGFDWAEGSELRVVADGNDIGDIKVEGGIIKLPTSSSVVHVGLPYIGMIKSLNLGYQMQGVNTQFTPKSLVYVVLRLFNSWGGKCGGRLDRLESILKFENDGNYDEPPLPTNSDVRIHVEDSYDENKSYFILQDKSLPFNISMLGYNLSQEATI